MSLRTELDAILTTMPTIATKSADAPLTELDWNSIAENIAKIKEALTKIKDLPSSTIPKGFLYVRFPGRPLPYGGDGVFNWTIETDWEKINEQYAGDFLRLAGGNASAFKADSEQIDHDNKVRGQGGGQLDALQTHGHLSGNETNNPSHGVPPNSFLFFGGRYSEKENVNNTNAIKQPINCNVDTETRPTNITVEMYLYMPN